MADTDRDVARLESDLSDLRDQVATLARSLDGAAEDSRAAARLRAAMDEARDRAGRYGRQARDQAVQATEATRDRITDHPLASVGAAFATGLLLGAVIGRR